MKARGSRAALLRFVSIASALVVSFLVSISGVRADDKLPVLVGADLAISDATNTTHKAIILGIRAAIDEVNRAGGVLGGRRLELVTTDNRSIPARGRENIEKLADMPNLVAVICGKYGAVVSEALTVANTRGLPMLLSWSATDTLIDNGADPNFVFRHSLRDSWAIQAMVAHARRRGFKQLGILVPANVWGRSSLAAFNEQIALHPDMSAASVQHYYWGGEKSLSKHYRAMQAAGAQAVLLVANEGDGAIFMHDVAAQPKDQRVPIISHWGILGTYFLNTAGPALDKVDLTFVTLRTLDPKRNAAARHLAEVAMKDFGVDHINRIPPLLGTVNAYELTHLLARAINKAGSTDRALIRVALENLGPYDGVLKRYERPFTRERHEALQRDDVRMARFGKQRDIILLPR